MPRQARKKSVSGIYHVMMRGVNREPIFHEDKDYLRFLEILAKVKEKAPFIIYAYCLMYNHVHLLFQELEESIGDTVRRISSSYVYGFNRKYNRVGHLFQERFHSEPVDDDPYFLTVLRYIHQNPIKAKITQQCSEYPWSSYAIYASAAQQGKTLVDTTFSLDLMGGQRELLKFINTPNNDKCLDLENVIKLSDAELLVLIEEMIEGAAISDISKMPPGERDQILRKLKSIEGTTFRQIARLTGLGRWMVSNA